MTRVVPLNSVTHRALCVKAGASGPLGDNQRFVPVIISEFAYLLPHYPILLSKDADTGAFYCGAMLGFDPGENLFLGDAQDAYRPLNLQRVPFFTAGSDLAVDLDSPRVSETDGQRLFTDGGEPTAYLQRVMALFRELQPGLARTRAFIDALLAHKLVEPIEINVGFDDGETRELQGVYTINQDVLRALPDEAVVELFRNGYLQLIHLMIASLRQVPVLAQKRNRRILGESGALAGVLA